MLEDETLALLLEGRLAEHERAAALTVLARSEFAYERFLEARALHATLQEPSLETEVAVPPSPPLAGGATGARTRAAPRARFRRAVPLLAAALALAIVVPAVVDRPEAAAPGWSGLATRLAGRSPATAFGADWTVPPWSTTRGDAALPDPEASAFRAGVHFADMAIAVTLDDSSAAAGPASALGTLVASADGGAAISAQLAQVARNDSLPARPQLARIHEQLRAFWGAAPWFDLGVWAESARLAARAGDRAHFATDGQAARELGRIQRTLGASLPEQGASARGPLAQLEARLSHSASPVTEPAELLPLLEQLIEAAAR